MSFRANIHTGFLPMKVSRNELIITDIDGVNYKVPIKAPYEFAEDRSEYVLLKTFGYQESEDNILCIRSNMTYSIFDKKTGLILYVGSIDKNLLNKTMSKWKHIGYKKVRPSGVIGLLAINPNYNIATVVSEGTFRVLEVLKIKNNKIFEIACEMEKSYIDSQYTSQKHKESDYFLNLNVRYEVKGDEMFEPISSFI